MSFSSNCIYRCKIPFKNYAWGSKDAFQQMYGVANPEHQPQAEIWMGAHPNGCSTLINEHGETLRLDALHSTGCSRYFGRCLGEFW